MLLFVKNWQVANKIQVKQNFSLEKNLLLPSFDMESFPFALSYGRDSYDLVNLKTGKVETLINGSAGNMQGQCAAFMISKGVGKFDLHLTTITAST